MVVYRCSRCSRSTPVEEPVWRCPCGGLFDLDYKPVIDPEVIRTGPPTLWRYRDAIPLPPGARIISLDEGFTPLTRIELDGHPVLIKEDQRFPTGSYKDRGASVLVSLAATIGVQELVEDSSGNAGAAIAAYAARAGIKARILVPERASEGKLALIRASGAHLERIPGDREATAVAARTAAESSFYASHCWNPFFLQGTKTFAYEVCEQLGWKAPDAVVVPVGNGTLLLGASIGFAELRRAGLIATVPRIVAVQAAHCAPLAQAFNAGSKNLLPPESFIAPDTMAEGIAIPEPVRGSQILKAVRDSGGHFITVSEDEITKALRDMAEEGHLIEATSAAAIAGLRIFLAQSGSRDTCIVSTFTGHARKPTKAPEWG